MISIKSLSNLTFETLYTAFNNAFEDYAISFEKEEVRRMLKRRGFDASLSFGAFDEDKLVAFTFNGIGNHLGKRTAYDTGTGTIKEYRGQGLAGHIFEYSLPFLKDAGIEQYLLEVLQDNKPAISVYKKQGFEITREFNCYTAKASSLQLTADNKYEIKDIELNPDKFNSFLDFVPSWQNSFDSVARNLQDFTILGAYENEELIAYLIFEESGGDISQIATKDIQSKKYSPYSLLSNLLENKKIDNIKAINIESTSDASNSFFKSIGFDLSSKQFEMIRPI